MNLETIIDTLSWHKIWQLSGYNPTRAKQKTSQETQKSLQKLLEPTRKPQVIYTDNSLEFGKSCEELSWNHLRQHRTDRKQMGLLRELYAGLRKGFLQYCCNQVWVTNGGRIPWNVLLSAKCSRPVVWWEKHHMKGGSECHFKDQ